MASYTFSFRKIKAAVLKELVQSLDVPEATVMAQFDAQDESGAEYRRKPVTVELTLPSFVDSLPELARDVIIGYIAQFVKSQYVDNFAEVGPHDWETIERLASERTVGGRRAQFDISDEVLKAAAQSLANFVTAGTGKKVVGEKFGKAVEQKFSRSAIGRNIGDITETLLDKLANWCERWIENVSEADPDNAEDFADVFSMLATKIDQHRGANVVNVADAL